MSSSRIKIAHGADERVIKALELAWRSFFSIVFHLSTDRSLRAAEKIRIVLTNIPKKITATELINPIPDNAQQNNEPRSHNKTPVAQLPTKAA